ncbi:MAG: hypothetical protein AAFY60_20670, partial [Myxococcota bacterium]
DQGSSLLQDVTAVAITEFSSTVYGPVARVPMAQASVEDTDNSDVYDDINDGTVIEFITVPAGAQRAIFETFAVSDPSVDLDLFVGIDTDGEGDVDESEEVCVSATAAQDELCEFDLLGESDAVNFWVVVQNWAGTGGEDSWSFGATVVPTTEGSSVTVNGPSGALSALTPFDVEFVYDIDAEDGEVSYGQVEFFSDAAKTAQIGSSNLDFLRDREDVILSATNTTLSVGDVVVVTANVGENVNRIDRTATVSVDVPAGLTVDEGSITQGGTLDGSTISWSVDQESVFTAEGRYEVSQGGENGCANRFAGNGIYVSLDAFNIPHRTDFIGNDVQYLEDIGVEPFVFNAPRTAEVTVTDDGFLYFT